MSTPQTQLPNPWLEESGTKPKKSVKSLPNPWLAEGKQGLTKQAALPNPWPAELKEQFEGPWSELTTAFKSKFGFDFYHKTNAKHERPSLAGNARDIGMKDLTPEQQDWILRKGEKFGLLIRDFRKDWKKIGGTGPHFHVQAGRKKPQDPGRAEIFHKDSLLPGGGWREDASPEDTAAMRKAIETTQLGMRPMEAYDQFVGPALTALRPRMEKQKEPSFGKKVLETLKHPLGPDDLGPAEILDYAQRPFEAFDTAVWGYIKDRYPSKEQFGKPTHDIKTLQAAKKALMTGEVPEGYENPLVEATQKAMQDYGWDQDTIDRVKLVVGTGTSPSNALMMVEGEVGAIGKIRKMLGEAGDALGEAGVIGGKGAKEATELRKTAQAGQKGFEEIGGKFPKLTKKEVRAAGKSPAPEIQPKGAPSPTAPVVGAPAVAGGSVDLGRVRTKIKDRFTEIRQSLQRPPSPKGKIADLFISNLNMLKNADPVAFEKAVASTSGMPAQVLARVHKQIEEVAHVPIQQFYKIMLEGQLRAVRERWQVWGREITATNPDVLAHDFKHDGGLRQVIQSISERHSFPSDLIKQGEAQLVEGNEAFKAWTQDIFDQAQSQVGQVEGTPGFQRAYDAAWQDPDFRRGVEVYKEHIQKPLEKAHVANRGNLTDARGPMDTYYPMMAVDEAGELRRGAKGITGSRVPYQPPKPMSKLRTGLARDYSTEIQNLARNVNNSIRSNNTGDLLNYLAQSGIGQVDIPSLSNAELREMGLVRRDVGPLRTILKETTSVREPLSRAEPLISKGTQSIPLGSKKMLFPEWATSELDGILDPKAPTQGRLAAVGRLFDTYAIRGFMEPAYHSNKLIKDLTTNMPFVGRKSVFNIVAGQVPFIRYANVIAKLVTTDVWNETALTNIQRLVEAGALPTKTGEAASGWFKQSRDFARLSGGRTSYFTFEPFLFGPGGLDTRARLVALQVLDEIQPGATAKEINQWVNQLGIYNRTLESRVGSALKRWHIGTFYSAGSSRLQSSVRGMIGAQKLPSGHNGWRAMMIVRGIPETVATWSGLYKVYTGKWPWQDPKARLMEIPLNDNDRKSWAGRLIFGKGNETAYIAPFDMENHIPGGFRAIGAGAMVNTMAEGGSAGLGFERGVLAQAPSTLIQPFISGPGAHLVATGIWGVSPYMTSPRDPITGRFGHPQFISTTQTRKPGLTQIAGDVGQGLESLNSFLESFLTAGNVGEKAAIGQHHGISKSGQAVRAILTIAAPGLIKGEYNLQARRAATRREEQAAEKDYRKFSKK